VNQYITSLTRVIDAPTATVVVGDEEDRDFLAELTIGAVATYLALKYIDGLVDGIGIGDLGKKHGAIIKTRITELWAVISNRPIQTLGLSERLDDDSKIISTCMTDLKDKQSLAAAAAAEEAVSNVLVQRGLPPAVAKRKAKQLAEVLWSGSN